MYAQIEKPKENKSRAVANSVAQKKSNVKEGFGFVDNRPEAVVQRRMQNQINKNLESKCIQDKITFASGDPVIQAVLTIGGLEQGELTVDQVANNEIRAILNQWRENGGHEFETLELAIEVATEYHNITTRIEVATAALAEDYINENWRMIEVIFVDLNNMYNDHRFAGVQGNIYHAKWEFVDAINEIEGGDNIQIDADSLTFKVKRQEIIVAGLNEPLEPDVAGDNAAGNVANAMNSDERVGHLNWVNGDEEVNVFRQWVADQQVEIGNDSSMNCWEAIFYSAYTANLMTREQIVELYKDVNEVGNNFLYAIDGALSPKTALFDIIDGGGLQRGDVILTTGWPGDHVAMSLGGENLLSLWNTPNDNLTLQRTTLRAIVDEENLSEVRVVRNCALFVAQ